MQTSQVVALLPLLGSVRETCRFNFLLCTHDFMFGRRKEGNDLFNNALYTHFIYRSDNERGNPLPPLNGLLFWITQIYISFVLWV